VQLIKNNRTVLSFSGAATLLSVVQLVANLLVIRWISPEQLGIWNTIIVFKSYALFLNFGVTNGLNRELPFLLGRNHRRVAKRIAESALFVSLAAAVLALATLTISSAMAETSQMRWSLQILGVVCALSFVNMYFGTTFRTNQAFLLFAKINVVLTGVELLTLLLPANYGYDGFLARIALIELVKLSLFLVFQPFPVLPRFSKFGFVFLISTGIPLFISTYLSAITDTFKRVILKGASSFEMVGLFSPALAVYSFNNLLPRILGQFIFPKLNHGLGAGDSPRSLWFKNVKFSVVNAILMAPVIVIGWFAIPPAIEVLFPEYTVGAHAAQLALLAGLFAPFQMLMNFFHTMKVWGWIYTLVVLKLTLFFVLQWVFVQAMEPMSGIAYGVLMAEIIYGLTILSLGTWYVRPRMPHTTQKFPS